MANHSLDCPYCGDDQRHTFPCCQRAREEHEERLRNGLAEEADRQALFQRHGIKFTIVYTTGKTIPEPDSVAFFLRQLEAQPDY